MGRARLSRDPVVFEELTCAFCRGRGLRVKPGMTFSQE
jgi:hypothetical protein